MCENTILALRDRRSDLQFQFYLQIHFILVKVWNINVEKIRVS